MSEAAPKRTPALHYMPGLLAAAAVLAVAIWLAGHAGRALLGVLGLEAPVRGNPVSPVSFAIVLGLLVGHFLKLPAIFGPGLRLAVRTVLRAGIVLIGLKLALGDVLRVGLGTIPLVLILVIVAFGTTWLLARLLGVGDRFALLVSAATSICGVTATVAAAPVIEAEEREVAYAIAIITLFGLVGMLTYPFVAHAVFAGNGVAAGRFLGTSIHDTSQVLGAALAYRDMWDEPRAFEVATVTKLTRNLFLIVVIPLLGWMARRRRRGAAAEVAFGALIPGFVVGFLVMGVLRSIGDWTLEHQGAALWVLDAASWAGLIDLLGDQVSYLALGVAMAALGMTTDLRSLRALGLRPLWVGAGAALAVGLTGLALAGI